MTFPIRAKLDSVMLKENTVDPKQEVPEYEEKAPPPRRLPEKLLSSSFLPRKDLDSDPGELDAHLIKDTKGGLKEKEEEDFYQG